MYGRRGRRRAPAGAPRYEDRMGGKARVACTRETELYAPVRAWLEAQGYRVRSEVLGCDVVATRGDDLVVVELKRALGLPLLVQATQRQRASDSVYLAVPRPPRLRADARWRGTLHVLRRLELGLLLVALGRRARIEVALHPLPYDRRKDGARRRALLAEAGARSGDHNTGGSRGRPLVTAYREQALHVAWLLERHGPAAPRALRAMGGGERTGAILYQDVYGWFVREGRGRYALGAGGRAALATFPEVVAALREPVDGERAS
jgi:hypothetical protein